MEHHLHRVGGRTVLLAEDAAKHMERRRIGRLLPRLEPDRRDQVHHHLDQVDQRVTVAGQAERPRGDERGDILNRGIAAPRHRLGVCRRGGLLLVLVLLIVDIRRVGAVLLGRRAALGRSGT